MKMFTLVSIIAISAIATAETAPTATTTTTTQETTTTAAPAEVKKVEKKKKAKKAKPAASTAESQGSTAMTMDASSAGTISTSNTATSNATTTATAVAPAAGSSTATVEATDASKKAFSGAVVVYPQASYHSNDLVVWTSPAIKYAVNDKLTVGVKQTFETLNGFNNDQVTSDGMKDNNFRAAFTDYTISSSLAGMMGSNTIPVSFNYKHINVDALKMSGYGSAYGMFEANLSLPYTISSKVDISIDTQIRHVMNKVGSNSNRILAVPSASYAFNDIVSVYQSAGYILSLRDNNELRRRFERMYLETGVNIAPIKDLTIGMNVNQDKAISAADSAFSVSDFTIYNATAAAEGETLDSVGYEAVITYKF